VASLETRQRPEETTVQDETEVASISANTTGSIREIAISTCIQLGPVDICGSSRSKSSPTQLISDSPR
jgi:hypothetical protein